MTKSYNKLTHRPIFIVGCSRSGTSLLRSIIGSHSKIACGPETHFLNDLERYIEKKGWERLQRYQFPKEFWYEKISDFFHGFKMEYAMKEGKERWAEKTPSYGYILSFINSLFPNCQIIHIIRDGRDVVASHRDRWGYWSALKATRKWKTTIQIIRNYGSNLPSNRYYEIKYEELVQNPEITLKELFQYLDEPWEANLLEEGAYENELTKSRRQLDAQKSVFYTVRIGEGKRSLDPLLKTLFSFQSRELIQELYE